VYNKNINFSDKNDLLRITDIYKRRDNKYETSIDLSNETQKYGYFYLNMDFENIFNDIELKVTNRYNTDADYNLLLDGNISTGKSVLCPGTFVESTDNCTYLNDESMFLSVKNKGCRVNHKIVYSNEQLKNIIKTNKERIVLTSGCFDIIHVGHIHNLTQAKNSGDKLMVCLSSDEQIKKLKGETRPVNNYSDRIDLFKMIECVDYIVLYDEVNNETEETLGEIMKIVDPYLWVKGSDYTVHKILNKHPYLRDIKILDNIPNLSTTNIIKKILKNTDDV
jgi:rfaE bifunctional protein nucleotidyltransferase chain/domain